MSPVFHSTDSSSSSRSYKICLVCENIGAAGEFGHEVFAIDVSPSCEGAIDVGPDCPLSVVLEDPLFRIPSGYPTFMGFFAFDSKIYFLGGYGGYGTSYVDGFSSDVFVYDISSSGIKKVGCMNKSKDPAVVIGPVHDKFYVGGKRLTRHDFEVFDPKVGTWSCLTQPPVPYEPSSLSTESIVCAHAVVNNGHEILLSTKSSGVFSYNTIEGNWSRFPECSLPFLGGAVPVGGDRFLVFIQPLEETSLILGTYCYNNSENVWHDFQDIWKINKLTAYNSGFFLFSLGDGLFCSVVSGYDRSPDDFESDEPSIHNILIGVFAARQNQEVGSLSFERLFFREYKDKYDMKMDRRLITAAFPLDVSLSLPSETKHL